MVNISYETDRLVWRRERKAMADEYRALRRNGQRVTARVIYLGVRSARRRILDAVLRRPEYPLTDPERRAFLDW